MIGRFYERRVHAKNGVYLPFSIIRSLLLLLDVYLLQSQNSNSIIARP